MRNQIQGINSGGITVKMFGPSGSGKTSLLYKFKLGDYHEAGPTPGFNAETVELDGGAHSMTIWDITGAHPELWRHFVSSAQGIIFTVDSSDDSQFHELQQQRRNELIRSCQSPLPTVLLDLVMSYAFPASTDEPDTVTLLRGLLRDPGLSTTPLLVFATKSDRSVLSSQELIRLLQLDIICASEGTEYKSLQLQSSSSSRQDERAPFLLNITPKSPRAFQRRVWRLQECSAITGAGVKEGLEWLWKMAVNGSE